MNPVTLAPPKGTRFHIGGGGGGSGEARPPLGEYTDSIFRQNRREELMLEKRLRVLDRHRSMATSVLRKSAEQTEHLQDSIVLSRSPTLYEYDRWRAAQRPAAVYGANAAGKSGVVSEKEKTRRSDGMARQQPSFATAGQGVTVGKESAGKRQDVQQQRRNYGASNSVIAVTVMVPVGYRK